MLKYRSHIFFDRFKDIISDPVNEKINRDNFHYDREKCIVRMYNGVLINRRSYYGSFSDILVLNKGVHEPLEEYIFDQIIKTIDEEEPLMIELGSYWAFYSLSLLQKKNNAKCYMIEPYDEELEYGKINFRLNNRIGEFIKGSVGEAGIKIDNLIKERGIEKINILHSDIQGYELEMLNGANNAFNNLLIDYVFLSTHSQDLHYSCLEWLREKRYNVIVSCDLEETTSYDGIIIAHSPNITLNIDTEHKNKKNISLIPDKLLNSMFYKNKIEI